MIRKIVITDVTHFNNEQKVCVAGIDINTGECLRPVSPDYLSRNHLKELNIRAGAVLSGEFQFLNNIKPHIEDTNYKNLKFEKFYSGNEFKEILEKTLSKNIEDGFGIILGDGQKHIQVSHNPLKSLITISVNPKSVNIFQDEAFGKKRIKIHFMDKNGKQYRFIPVNDLDYWLYANNCNGINSFIHAQWELFLRIGVGRQYKSQDGRDGYWLQVNGIYSFPEYFRFVTQ